MGATQSHKRTDSHGYYSTKQRGNSSDVVKLRKKTSHGKPSPPSQPRVQDVNPNCVTLTWHPPRHNGGSSVLAYTVEQSTSTNSQWTVLTSCCQGNSYQVKNLRPHTEYIFRVRAENVHGVGKPSTPSDSVRTSAHHLDKEEEMEEERRLEASSELTSAKSVARRRHSVSLHLEGTVSSILIRSDPSAAQIHASVAADREQRAKETMAQLQREAHFRSSLQPGRKRALPIVLPGTKTNSMRKLRDSQTCPSIRSLQTKEGSGTLRKTDCSLNNSCESGIGEELKFERKGSEGSADDVKDVGGHGETEASVAIDEVKACGALTGEAMKEEASDPWQKVNSLHDMADGIMTAPVSDDVKMALFASSQVADSSSSSRQAATDFRALRSLLHSDEIFVKPTRSMPDVTAHAPGGQRAGSVRSNKLSTIVDTDEWEESVRVTTL